MTVVWTSVGAIAGVLAVGATDWQWLDPVIALVVALNIVATGVSLLRRSGDGLMDHALPAAEETVLRATLEPYRQEGVVIPSIWTRPAGAPSSHCTSWSRRGDGTTGA